MWRLEEPQRLWPEELKLPMPEWLELLRQQELRQELQKHKGRPGERRDGNSVRLLSHEVQIHLNWNLNRTDVDMAGSWEHR